MPPAIFQNTQFIEYKQKCMDMANNIDNWYEENILGVGFENDDDFENLKKSPINFDKKEEDSSPFGLLRAGTFKLSHHMQFKFRGGGDQSPRKRASKKQA